MVLSIGANAVSFAVIPKLLNSEVDNNMKQLAMGGAITEAVSSYVYSNVLSGSGSILGL